MNTEDGLETMRDTILEEAALPPAAPRWTWDVVGLGVVHGVVAAVALLVADAVWHHAPRAPGATVLLLVGATVCGVVATVALGSTSRRLAITSLALLVAGVVAHIAGRAPTTSALWWADADCALAEVAMAAVPAAATTVTLRRFAFQPGRALLGGAGAAATGLWVLDLTCPADGAFHAFGFHVVPALAVVAAALLVRRALTSRSHVP